MNASEPQSTMNSRKPLKYVFLAVASAGLLAGMALHATAPDPEALPPAPAQAQALHTYRVEARLLQPRTSIAGLLEARREVELFAESEGRVIEVGAEELERVEAEQLLLRLDPLLAEVAVERARAAIERAASSSALARAQLKRNQGLADVEVASRAALDEAENASRQARAAGMEAEAALTEARDRLAKKIVRAPLAGVLRTFPVEVGEYVRPGERIAELLSVDRVRITVGLTDRQIVAIVPGTEVDVEIDARSGESFMGRVISIGGAVDSKSRKFPVRIEIQNAEGRLLPGMVARIDLPLGEKRQMMVIPLDSLTEAFGLKHVYVVEASGDGGWVASERRVKVRAIPFRPTQVEVMSGLAEGEQIAISSIKQLRDGMVVRPLPSDGGKTERRMGAS